MTLRNSWLTTVAVSSVAILFILAVNEGCGLQSKPSEELVKKTLIECMARNNVNSGDEPFTPIIKVFDVINIVKTNGLSKSKNEYVLEFAGKARVIKAFYKNSLYGTFFDKSRMNIISSGVGSVTTYSLGQDVDIKGTAEYILSEKGWIIKILKATIGFYEISYYRGMD